MSYKTAISRRKLSAPARYLLGQNKIKGLTNYQGLRRAPLVLDYGCGKGGDSRRLGIAGFDPHYFPWTGRSRDARRRRKTILCTYVLNVIESPAERVRLLADIYSLLLPGGQAYITVRSDKQNLKGRTKRGTWQGFVELPLPVEHKAAGYTIYRLEKETNEKTRA